MLYCDNIAINVALVWCPYGNFWLIVTTYRIAQKFDGGKF